MGNHTLRSNYHKSFETGMTASTTQSQGNGVLTAAINEIATVANDGDTVTLPAAVEGFETVVINNGAKALQIFPASGDNLGNGLNASVNLAANEEMKFFGTGGTSYHIENTTEIFHAEIHNYEDNTSEYVIHAANEEHAYHDTGIVGGDVSGWTFNAGSNGTPIAISSVADNGSGTILLTTSAAHGLSVGDVICHTALSDSNYVGFFTVLTVPTTTTYTVTATWGATGTGFVDEPAHIHVQDIAIGTYMITWTASLSVVGSAITLDFHLHDGANVVAGSGGRHRIASSSTFKMIGGQALRKVVSGDRIFFAFSNTTNSTNLTIRDFSLIAIKL